MACEPIAKGPAENPPLFVSTTANAAMSATKAPATIQRKCPLVLLTDPVSRTAGIVRGVFGSGDQQFGQ